MEIVNKSTSMSVIDVNVIQYYNTISLSELC